MKTKPGGAEDQINTAENALVEQEDEKKSKKKKHTLNRKEIKHTEP